MTHDVYQQLELTLKLLARPRTRRELCEALDIHARTGSRLLLRLIRLGWVRRVGDVPRPSAGRKEVLYVATRELTRVRRS